VNFQPKNSQESATEMVQVVLPNDTNPLGHVLGGRVMHWIDLVGAIVAHRHSRRPVVTASMERLDFICPIRLGQVVILKAALNFVGRTSMEVGVEVYAEDPTTGRRLHTSHAVLTYVALDDRGMPMTVPGLVLETDEDKRRFEEGRQRREARLARRAKQSADS
jgi:acyl-CoA hydrolase